VASGTRLKMGGNSGGKREKARGSGIPTHGPGGFEGQSMTFRNLRDKLRAPIPRVSQTGNKGDVRGPTMWKNTDIRVMLVAQVSVA
jgi:hypothetical protein